ncbi:MAG TPA: shikimate kinase [Spirochaetia bacterium]|nr:shikimate kinase [Spirochaetia bacterium]
MKTLPQRIILIGFMGSGKSSVGRILADRLGYELVDTDALLEERAGAPIPRIFREQGEPAFRALESEVLASVADRTRSVIATGGGAPAHPANREFFTREDAVFHLRVSLKAARERTGENADRPLLAQDPETVRGLYQGRQSVYEKLGQSVDTDGRTPDAVADEIMRLLRNPRRNRPPGENA